MFFIRAAKSPDRPKNHTNLKIKSHNSKTLQTSNTKQIRFHNCTETATPNSEITIQGITCKIVTRVTEHNYEFHFDSVRMKSNGYPKNGKSTTLTM